MRLERVRRDGRALVVKHTGHPATFEAEGLAVLAEAGAPVPEIVEVGEHHLVMADLDVCAPGPATRDDWAKLGERLAEVHRTIGPSFGWHRDNVIGTITQHNEPRDDWATFHHEQRIAPYLGSLPRSVAARLRDGREQLAVRLDHDVVPSLLHGDLWSGNVLHGRWLIDPAVCHADRELDLAFATLFGGIPDPFFAAYDAAWPRDDGWRGREPLLQLYHLLVHVELFGAGYVPPIVSRLDAAGL